MFYSMWCVHIALVSLESRVEGRRCEFEAGSCVFTRRCDTQTRECCFSSEGRQVLSVACLNLRHDDDVCVWNSYF